jgi:ribonuclease PH
MKSMGVISSIPLKNAVAATSVGIVRSYMMMDLCYDEDSQAEVDANVVMTDQGILWKFKARLKPSHSPDNHWMDLSVWLKMV